VGFFGYMRTSKCSECGKEFIVPQYNIYKLRIGGKNYHYCCYSCYRIAQRREEKAQTERKGRRGK
jgi:hypothetical protein